MDKWYDNKALVIVLLIVFFPVGLYALWKNQHFSKNAKLVGTLIILLLCLVGAIKDIREKQSRKRTVTASPQTASAEAPQRQTSAPSKSFHEIANKVIVRKGISGCKVRLIAKTSEEDFDKGFNEGEAYMRETNKVVLDAMRKSGVAPSGSAPRILHNHLMQMKGGRPTISAAARGAFDDLIRTASKRGITTEDGFAGFLEGVYQEEAKGW